MMEFIDPLLGGIAQLSDPWLWLFVLLGTIIGVIVGALPGIGVTLTYGLLLPFTFMMSPVHAIAFLLAIQVGNGYGNSIPAILMGIPGGASAILSVIEGHALHKRGEGALALAISFVAALGGQAFSIILFILMVVPLMQLAYQFLHPEQFALYLMGIVAIAAMTGKNILKGLIAAGIGFIIGLIGLDPINPVPRLTLGIQQLRTGIDLTPVVIGLLAMSELFRSSRQVFRWKANPDPAAAKFPPWRRLAPTALPIVEGTVVGTFVGAIPGADTAPAAMISYQVSMLLSKHPEEFGKGSVEGLAANEAAQNASNSGELAPALALGIPTTSTAVLLLSALTVHGFVPGPLMLRHTPDLFYAAVSGMLAATILLVFTGWYIAKAMLRAVNINRSAIIVFCFASIVLGTYATHTRIFDVYVVIACGAIGYLMLQFGYSTAAASLACVLGVELERTLRYSLNITKGDFFALVSRPITGTILLVTIAFVALGVARQYQQRRRGRQGMLAGLPGGAQGQD